MTYDVNGKFVKFNYVKYSISFEQKQKSFVSLKCFKIKRIVAYMCKMMQSLFLFNVKSKPLIETTKTHDSRVMIVTCIKPI